MTLPPTIRDQILQHSQAEQPKECCGVVCVVKGRRRYFPVATWLPRQMSIL